MIPNNDIELFGGQKTAQPMLEFSEYHVVEHNP